MTTKSIPWYVWIVPIALLLIATARLPYGYYTFTHIVVCAAAALFAFIGWNEGQLARVLSVVLAQVAVLFNPLVPIYLPRDVWFVLDIVAAAAFAAHLGLVRLRRT